MMKIRKIEKGETIYKSHPRLLWNIKNTKRIPLPSLLGVEDLADYNHIYGGLAAHGNEVKACLFFTRPDNYFVRPYKIYRALRGKTRTIELPLPHFLFNYIKADKPVVYELSWDELSKNFVLLIENVGGRP